MPDQSVLLAGLNRPDAYPHPVEELRAIETHISAVFLTGRYAYKLKKALDLGFLDFSTLERRKRFCEEELRLNRRLAPQLYIDVLPVTGTPQAPRIGGDGDALDYVLRMHQFDPEQQLDRLLERGELDARLLDRLIPIITGFHAEAARASVDSDYGRPEVVFAPMQQNFDQLRPLITDPAQTAQLDRLEDWTRQQFEKLLPLLEQRRDEGYIRECHGDMHLGNMTLMGDEIAVFDGIEFNDDFRWIDVANEIAFFVMDLESRGAPHLAHHVLNAWLESTGDYPALKLMRFYQAYRAMVRAKVASIRLGQPGLPEEERAGILAAYQRYADLAESYASQPSPALLITHGFSGAGKTTVSGQLVDELGVVRIRSDIERKRLHGLDAQARSQSQIDAGLYDPAVTERTYEHLRLLAGETLRAGYSVAVDATFLKRSQRDRFADLAREHGCPFLIVSVEADAATLETRVEQRCGDASEATAEVIRQQRKSADPLAADEAALVVDSLSALPTARIRELLSG
ncbi:bifunctional aminoglycoside phosphotransferase/ATP-binding protein [Acidihalobacter prosperus]